MPRLPLLSLVAFLAVPAVGLAAPFEFLHYKNAKGLSRMCRGDVATGEVVIGIQDNGQGIPEKNLARIFDPFFTTKEVGVGTGLGLSVVYGIVQQHRGSIAVQSKAGQGTSFFIRLPGAGSPTP